MNMRAPNWKAANSRGVARERGERGAQREAEDGGDEQAPASRPIGEEGEQERGQHPQPHARHHASDPILGNREPRLDLRQRERQSSAKS